MKATAASAIKATQVIETVELMENILLHLGTRDVLRAQQVTRTMRNTVNGSNKIQKTIGLLPDEDSYFATPLWEIASTNQLYSGDGFYHDYVPIHGITFSDYRGTLCGSYDSRYDDIQSFGCPPPQILKDADFLLTCPPQGPILQKLGTRVRSLLPCQPPMAKMDISYLCTYCKYDWGDDIPIGAGTLMPSNGSYITLGDIQDAVLRTRMAHRAKCDKRCAKSRVTVELTGSIALKREDPVRIQRSEEGKDQEDQARYWLGDSYDEHMKD